MRVGMASKLERLSFGSHTRIMELFVNFFDCFLPSLSAIHLLHGHDHSTEGFATPNTPPIYGRPVNIYTVSHVVVYLYALVFLITVR
jgi:hypothetical protein